MYVVVRENYYKYVCGVVRMHPIQKEKELERVEM